MTNTHTVTRTDDEKKDRRRRALAIVAVGTVLGIGATAVLASWNDSEFVQGLFGTGNFGIEGAAATDADGVGTASSPAWEDYAEHPNLAGKADLDFSFALDATKLSKNDTVGAKFKVRLIDGTTNVGELTVSAADKSGLSSNLQSGLTTKVLDLGTGPVAADAACGASQFASGTTVEGGAALTPALTQASGGASTEHYLCFLVSSDDTVQAGQQAAPIVWNISATSTGTSFEPITN